MIRRSFFLLSPHLSNQTPKHPYYLDTFQHWFLLFCFTISPAHLHAPSRFLICCLCHDHSPLQVPSFIQTSNGFSLIDSALYSLSHFLLDTCARCLKKPIVQAHGSRSNSVLKNDECPLAGQTHLKWSRVYFSGREEEMLDEHWMNTKAIGGPQKYWDILKTLPSNWFVQDKVTSYTIEMSTNSCI